MSSSDPASNCPDSRRAPLIEVFSSIQGEGVYVGEPQVLFRLAGCPLRCRWCDTPESRGVDSPGEPRRWISPFEGATAISEADPVGGLSVSVTGGEPTLWPRFLLELRTLITTRRLHLETAGPHPDALEQVIDAVDHISLDLKLPEDLDPSVPTEGESGASPAPHGDSEWAAVRARILPLLRDRDACGKLVLRGGVDPAGFDPILDDVAELHPTLPLILQPVTPTAGIEAPEPFLLESVVTAARARNLAIRVIPQIHRQLGLA
jgi:7-carboxy-7-deazaguanine synthase